MMTFSVPATYRPLKRALLGLALASIAAGCGVSPSIAAPLSATRQPQASAAKSGTLKTGVPLIRFFRGFRKADLSPGQYIADLQNRFIPAAPATHAKNGLVAYLPAVPPAAKPAFIPDELALIMYENDAVYQAARSTPEGKAYSDLHWDVFDKERSKSGSAAPFTGTIQADQPYDVLGRPTDWQSGTATLFVGARNADVTPDAFLAAISARVARTKAHGEKADLAGYLVVAAADYVAEYKNWTSARAAARARTQPGGASDVLGAVMDEQASVFAGKISWGQVVNARFARREPNN
ncbi:MAG: hypothetical protein FJZ00_08365 [Candidatus Sericytochromatia bacterium]|uniref:Uncharacterized protein n=1 Tax=Candidatus Tanganyikabacteria bacterium TaxID=2961651 RepID=A0A937X3A1_9BACT|nr:hypothetical protein [Candidatus Tanganyikabacteria bacterium]